MKKTLILLGFALTLPAAALKAQAPRGKGPGGPPLPPGPQGPNDGPGEVHDDPHHNPMFHALLRAIDTDGDGIISMHEMNHAAESLLKLDKNGDGKISHDELVGHREHRDGPPPPRGPKPEKGDKPDAPKDDNQKAGEKDDNAKPNVEKDKQKENENDSKPRKGKGDNNNDQPDNPPPPPPREDEQRSALVDAIDTNHDGEISADEIAAARANLKKLDVNHDGQLSPWEYGRRHRH